MDKIRSFLKKILFIFPYLCIISLIVLVIWYIKRTFVDVIFLDGFINIQLVGRYLRGDHIPISQLFIWSGEHLNIGYLLITLLNAKLFDLDMRLDPMLFLFADIIVAILIFIENKKIYFTQNRGIIGILTIPLAFLCFSLVAPPLSLMSTQFALGSSVAFLIAFLFQRILVSSASKNLLKIISILILIPIYFFFLSGAYFPGLVFGIFSIYLTHVAIQRKLNFQVGQAVLLLILLCVMIYYYFGFLSRPSHQGKEVIGLIHYFSDFWNTCLSYITGIGASVIDIHTVEKNPQVILWIGGICTLFSIFAVILFFRTKMYLLTYLPIYCIFYTLGVITSVRLGRGANWGWIMAEWYSFHLTFLIIGIVWIFSYSLFYNLKSNESFLSKPIIQKGKILLVGIALIFIFTTQLYANIAQWQRGWHVYQWLYLKKSALLYPEKYPNYYEILLWPKDDVDRDRLILEKYKLSSFSSKRKISFIRTILTPLKGSKP